MARRRRLLYPERRMRDIHPFTLWKALMRLKVLAKLSGQAEEFHRPMDLARHLYDNWDELTIGQQCFVLDCKFNLSLRFLKVERWIIEQEEHHPSYYTPRKLDAYQARESVFSSIPNMDKERAESLTRDAMDHAWGDWIGRRPLKIPVDF